MKLGVPYRSQWGVGANESRNDCGPVCLAMILAAYGIYKSADEVFRATGASPDSLINFSQLIDAGKEFGLPLRHLIITIEELKEKIADGFPAIALINYKYFPKKQDTYNGPHFVTVFGKTSNTVIVHDPNRLRGDEYGDTVTIKNEPWKKMWAETNEQHGNRNCQVLIPNKSLLEENGEGDLSRRQAIVAVYKGILGHMPSKADLDRWDMSQKGIDECAKELLVSLEYPKKIEELEQEISRLKDIINEKENQHRHTAKERDEARGERDEARKQVESLKDEVARISDSLVENQKKNLSLQEELDKRNKEEKDFGVQALEAERKWRQEVRRTEKLEKDKQVIEEELKSCQRASERLRNEIAVLGGKKYPKKDKKRREEVRKRVQWTWNDLWDWISTLNRRFGPGR